MTVSWFDTTWHLHHLRSLSQLGVEYSRRLAADTGVNRAGLGRVELHFANWMNREVYQMSSKLSARPSDEDRVGFPVA